MPRNLETSGRATTRAVASMSDSGGNMAPVWPHNASARVCFVTIERRDPLDGIKVVPMYIEPQPDDEPEQPPAPTPPLVRRAPRPLLGIVALAFAVVCALLTVAGVTVATSGVFPVATLLAYAAIALSVLAVLGGLAAMITRRGRFWGVAAILIGLVGNPVLLLSLLKLVSALQSH
jgi:hypothetical protein